MRTGNQATIDMKHIVIATETFTPEINGVANTLQHLCHGLMQRGHRVSVVRPRQQNEARGLYFLWHPAGRSLGKTLCIR